MLSWTAIDSFLDAVPLAAVVFDRAGVIRALNQVALGSDGLKREDLVGRHFWDTASWTAGPDTRDALLRAIAGATEGNRSSVELAVDVPGSRREWIQMLLTPLLRGDFPEPLVLATSMSISRHVELEAQLRTRTEQVQRALASMREAQQMARLGSWETQTGSGMIRCSEELLRILEVDSRADTIPRDELFARVHPSDRPQVVRPHGAGLSADPYVLTFRLQMPDGRVKHVRHRVQAFRDNTGRVARFAGTLQDISDQVRTEQDARDTATLLSAVMDASPDWIFLKDAEYRYRYVNLAFADVLGLPKEEVVGRVDTSVLPRHVSTPASDMRFRSADDRALAGEAVHLPDSRVAMRDGSVRINDTIKVPVRKSDGEGTDVLTIARDVSDRRRAEDALAAANAELEAKVAARTARLEAANAELEAFAYTVSHDLKTPLRAMDGYSRLLQDSPSLRSDTEAQGFVRAIRQSADRMNAIITGILEYSKLINADAPLRAFNAADVVGAVVDQFRLEIPPGAEMCVTLPFAEASGDAEGLAIVVRNLVSNAVKFASGTRRLRVDIGGREDASGWTLWVRDNGIGFDIRLHDKVFEWCERLHPQDQYPGTGIGLAVARKVMTRMGGRMWAESAPDEGATFFVHWPRKADARVATSESSPGGDYGLAGASLRPGSVK